MFCGITSDCQSDESWSKSFKSTSNSQSRSSSDEYDYVSESLFQKQITKLESLKRTW